MNSIKKNLGVIAAVIGALLLVLPVLVSPISDLLDVNIYLFVGLILIIGGIIAHIILNKMLPLDDEEDEREPRVEDREPRVADGEITVFAESN